MGLEGKVVLGLVIKVVGLILRIVGGRRAWERVERKGDRGWVDER